VLFDVGFETWYRAQLPGISGMCDPYDGLYGKEERFYR